MLRTETGKAAPVSISLFPIEVGDYLSIAGTGKIGIVTYASGKSVRVNVQDSVSLNNAAVSYSALMIKPFGKIEN